MLDLRTFGGSQSEAVAVSNGQVVGWADAYDSTHAFSWTQAGGMVDLGTLGGLDSEAVAVSNGQVVGWVIYDYGYNNMHAFSWTQAAGSSTWGRSAGPKARRSRSATVRLWVGRTPTTPSTLSVGRKGAAWSTWVCPQALKPAAPVP